MDTTVTVEIGKAPGILTRLITMLKRLDLTYVRHTMVDGEGGGPTRMAVTVVGPEIVERTLYDQLKEVRGVIDVIGIEVQQESGDRPDNDEHALISNLLSAYPKIYEQLLEHESNIPVEARPERMKMLGTAVGTGLVKANSEWRAINTFPNIVDEVVIPTIKPISVVERDGNLLDVKVSVFTRSQHNIELVFGAEREPCHFLTGLITGLIRGNGKFPTVTVKEERCRNQGDEFCRFKIFH